ncbi:MAG TPA: DUF1501 domain-containing protein [Planctomycetota bacterium]|nr:DUF1501 domain-containing protein [Planctomycetota bacterium]
MHVEVPRTRREFLAKAGGGFGALAMASLLDAQQAPAHYPARAKSVIFLFMEGGPSGIDLFDPKPKLNELQGQPLPPSFKPVITAMGEYGAPLLGSRRTWMQHPKCGLWYSDWVPHIGGCLEDIAVLRSCVTDGINHSGFGRHVHPGGSRCRHRRLGGGAAQRLRPDARR